MGFARVKEILDQALVDWQHNSGFPPNLTGHGPTFSWDTKEKLLEAVGHGARLIPPDMIGNGKGHLSNLIIDLRKGLSGPASRMPKGGPFIPDDQIDEIETWIDAGCPD